MFATIFEDPIEIKGGIEIPYPYAISTACRIFEMAEWIYNEFIDDCKSKATVFGEKGLLSEEMQAFQLRNTSRTVSWVTHVWNIEKILNQALGELEDMFDSLPIDISEFINLCKMERGKEIERVENFRNKVAAHSSWSHHSRGDTDADREASLGCWSGSCSVVGGSLLNFYVGGCSPIKDGVVAKIGDYRIGIFEEHQKMIAHFKAWEANLVDLMNKLEGLSSCESK